MNTLLALFVVVDICGEIAVSGTYQRPVYQFSNGKDTTTGTTATTPKPQRDNEGAELKSPFWIGDPFWPVCKQQCNFVELCLTDALDPQFKVYPHCDNYPSLTVPPPNCMKCMVKNGFKTPSRLSKFSQEPVEPTEKKCSCRRVQSVTTVVPTSSCPTDVKQTMLCEVSDAAAEMETTDVSTCSCGEEVAAKAKKPSVAPTTAAKETSEQAPKEISEDDML